MTSRQRRPAKPHAPPRFPRRAGRKMPSPLAGHSRVPDRVTPGVMEDRGGRARSGRITASVDGVLPGLPASRRCGARSRATWRASGVVPANGLDAMPQLPTSWACSTSITPIVDAFSRAGRRHLRASTEHVGASAEVMSARIASEGLVADGRRCVLRTARPVRPAPPPTAGLNAG